MFSLRLLRSPRLLLFVAALALIVTLLLGFSIRLPGVKITRLARVVAGCPVPVAVCASARAVVLGVSRDARERARRWFLSPPGVFSAITLLAVVMSFGPDIH